MKAGFVGFSGAAGTTAGLVGAGGSFGLSGSILAGGSAITPVAPTAVSSAALSTAPTVISGIPGATGATTGMGFSTATPISGLTTTTSTGAFTASTPISGLTTTAATPVTKVASTTSTKSGFLKGLKNTLIDGVKAGGKSLVAQGMYNLAMHGDIKGPKFEQDLYGGGGGRASSYTGSYALPDAITFTQQGLGSDTIGSTYVNMLQNLNYGTGSLDYARHTNMALMRGIQIPQIQYA
tara:strand:+ start:2509 stop:3219 length:711 start_codon:yes stop_codon:yes gene_type:complete